MESLATDFPLSTFFTRRNSDRSLVLFDTPDENSHIETRIICWNREFVLLFLYD